MKGRLWPLAIKSQVYSITWRIRYLSLQILMSKNGLLRSLGGSCEQSGLDAAFEGIERGIALANDLSPVR
jgi:hypothetical protein